MLTPMNFITGSVHIEMPVERILRREHPLGDALADDHDRFGASPVGVVEVAARDDRDPERREESGRDGAEPRPRILFAVRFRVSLAENWKPGPKVPASRQGTIVPTATRSTPGSCAIRRIASL